MSLQIGIVGLANVGKSTLFNALLKKQVAVAANYPFATIEPNIGVVPVPDPRLAILADVVKTEKVVPATVKFVDIAGLVKGASTGEGLGNKFLAHIREVDAIVHVLRGFSDEDVVRVGSWDPDSDLAIVETELQLADLEVAEKLLEVNKKDMANPDHGLIITILQSMVVKLKEGRRAGEADVPERLKKWKKGLPLLTVKPAIKVLNVDEDKIDSYPNFDGVVLSAKLESELGDEVKDLGISESGLEKLIKKAYEVLDLQSFLTAGEKEVRAWTIKKGTKAPQAAGVIHTDFEKHFIKADVINWEELVNLGGWARAREAGKVRLEGRDYVMREGDVVEFKVGV
ncbi:redox-regulated ATPase YchF [Candidatus Amesbacteria bacterium]|nr:redox-regulated ATPase YchF [Candidatus Amesbacteria bacterium]MBI2587616.1 redox-regulated ATPase YchF [Candidatus Amesbacteria bacterium]